MVFGLFKRKKEDDLGGLGLADNMGLSNKDTLGLGSTPGQNFGLGNELMPSTNSMGLNQPFNPEPAMNLSTIQQPSMSSAQPQGDLQKDLQILSLKLDAIKAEMDSMNQRLKNIESIAQQQSTQKKWY